MEGLPSASSNATKNNRGSAKGTQHTEHFDHR